jgi:sugar lactone lactonase YvrE
MNQTFVRRCLILTAAFACLTPAFAVETRFWQQGEFSDFEKGNLKNLSLRSDGRLTLAPVLKELFDTSTPYLWAAALDSKGNVYVAGGAPSGSSAKLFQITPSGSAKTIAELDGLEIHAIAVDRNDRVYAATVPDGKIYRVVPGTKPEVFYDPKAKYIWAMAFASNGDLFVATGDRGEVFRVPPDGKGSVFFRTEETHARSLAIDSKDNLIVGTEPGGLIVRVTAAGQGFVLYQANKREVTAVAVSANGPIYAAAVGSKPTSSATTPPAPAPAPLPAPTLPPAATQPPGTTQRPAVTMTAPPTLAPSAPSVTGGSEIYRIDPDGSPRRVWQNAQDVVYALAFDSKGRPVFGTGNKGNIYRLDSELTYTLLENVPPTQVTAFAKGHNGNLYAVTGNVGKVYQIGPGLEPQGTYESEVFDAGAFSYWGRLIFRADPKSGVAFQARSGNVNHAQKNWSPWTAVNLAGDGGRVEAPPARFLQYRADLRESGGAAPELVSVDLAYMAKNIAPVVEEIEITPANYKFSTPALALTGSIGSTITLPPMGQKKKSASSALDLTSASSQSMTYGKGWAGVRWAAADDNGDTLCYKVEIRGSKETDWKLLKDTVRDKHFAFDSTAFPDGEYVLRITASDAPSNPPDQALSASLVSDPLLIDNTPPEVVDLKGSLASGKVNVSWTAKDTLSLIDKAEYSVNGGEWLVVEPVTRLSDASDLQYRLTLDRPGTGETTIAVRVTDEYDNQAVQKVVLR